MILAFVIMSLAFIATNLLWYKREKKILAEKAEERKRFDDIREDFNDKTRVLRRQVQQMQDSFFPNLFLNYWKTNHDINPEKAKMIYVLLQCVQLMYEGRIKVRSFYPGKQHTIRNMQLIKEIMKIANTSKTVKFKFYNMTGDIRSEEYEMDNKVYQLLNDKKNEEAGQE